MPGKPAFGVAGAAFQLLMRAGRLEEPAHLPPGGLDL